MRIDLAGQVNAIHLPVSRALLPLFEAVVNAVEAVHERGNDDGLIEIRIARTGMVFAGTESDSQFIPDVADVEIIDNGVGFTKKHFNSFDTSYSTLKAKTGGKGVGRLIWLKAFERAEVDSVYPEDVEWHHRSFSFVPTRRGIENAIVSPVEVPPAMPRTSVRLIGFQAPYREQPPKGAQPIALRVVEHCLVLYMIDAMPTVMLYDRALSLAINLDKVFENEVRYSSSVREFVVGGETFQIRDAMLRASADTENAIHFCANKREVQSSRLSNFIAHAEAFVRADGVELRYAACVTGAYLDSRVNAQRTGFDVDRQDAIALYGTGPTWEEIEQAAIAAAAEYLEPQLEEARERAIERVEKFIVEEEPRYRVLLQHRHDELEKVSGALTDEKLELELHKLLASWRHDVKVEVARKLREVPDDAESLERYERDAADILEELGEVVKSELAEYVYHRRTVLDFMARMLGMIESGKFAREDVLHGLFFPTRTTSSHVDYDKHNLWILDERLAFHQFLASDIAFSRQAGAPVQVEGENRPDILIYNHPMAFAENTEEANSVVIVEFKKPERNAYTDTDNPIDQVLEYVDQVQAGRAVRPDGSRVLPPRPGTPFYCHVVVTMSAKLRDLAKKRGYHPTPDGQGFFDFNENFRAYIEIVDYRKVHSDAVKRNKVFFEKLGLHTGTRRPPR